MRRGSIRARASASSSSTFRRVARWSVERSRSAQRVRATQIPLAAVRPATIAIAGPDPSRVGDEPRQERADDEAEVAPEAVDADDLHPLDWLHRIGDRRDERRIDERRSDAEQDSRAERGREGAVAERRARRGRPPA